MVKPVILLCNPPAPSDGMVERDAASGMGAVREWGAEIEPPHTLAWSAAMLRKAGWRVKGLDAIASRLDKKATLTSIEKIQPTIIVLQASPLTAKRDLPFIKALRAHLPDLKIMLIGLATRYLPASTVRAVDMVLAGEPEGALDAACTYLLSQEEQVGQLSPLALNLPGYDAQGNLLDLNHLPPPAWDLFPVERYDWLPIVTTRGCSLGCKYCPVPVTQGEGERTRIAERVVAEMQLLSTLYGVRTFRFRDPVFGTDREHVETLCKILIRQKLHKRIRWSCESRPESLDLPLLRMMSDAGCERVHLGLESVSPETLMAIGRVPDVGAVQTYLTRARQVIFGCRVFGIDCHVHVMAGLPGDRAGATITRTYLRAYSPQVVQVSPLTPYPGTSIFPTNQIHAETKLLRVKRKRRLPTNPVSSRWWHAFAWATRLPSF